MNQIILIVVLPLLAAFLIPVLDRVSRPLARITGPAVLLYSLWLITTLWLEADHGPGSFTLGGFRPPLGISFYVDDMALLFSLLVAAMTLLLWPWKATGGARQEALMMLLTASASGLVLSGDLFNIYVFYELIAVSGFGLIAVSGTGAVYAATVRYLVVSSLGSVMALTGIALIYTRTGTLNLAQLAELAPVTLADPLGLAAFFCLLIGVGVKGELFPVNTWVPEVYAAAPTRVSGLLAGLVSKLALLVIVRLLVLLFPYEPAQQIMLILGLIGVVSGEFAAWRARDMKRMLAFSSIAQLGMVFVAFALPGEAGLMAGLLLALHHLVVKPGLFLLATSWGGSLQGLAGAAAASPLGAALFVLFALSLVGVPPLPGFWAKFLLITALAGEGQVLHLLAMAAVLLATAVEANYMIGVIQTLLGKTPREGEGPAVKAHPWPDLSASALLGLTLLAATFFLAPITERLDGIAKQAADASLYIDAVFPADPLVMEGRL